MAELWGPCPGKLFASPPCLPFDFGFLSSLTKKPQPTTIFSALAVLCWCRRAGCV